MKSYSVANAYYCIMIKKKTVISKQKRVCCIRIISKEATVPESTKLKESQQTS